MTNDDRLIGLEDLESYHGSPLYLFVGIDTGGSKVHEAFPTWVRGMGIDARLRGVNIPESASPATWERLVKVMRSNPSVRGAVITSHKLRLHQAARHLFDEAEPLVGVTHEVNSLDTREGVRAFARDAQSLDIVLHEPTGHLADGRPLACLGAGGSAIALLLATHVDVAGTVAAGHVVPADAGRAVALTVMGRRQASLDEIHEVAARAGLRPDTVSLVLAAGSTAIADELAKLPDNALVINATGLGKTGPGSPLDGPDSFPAQGAAWDFNYRGPLTFLEQARTAGLPTDDGWDYFLAGWACALSAITDQPAHEVLELFRRQTVR